VIGYALNPRHKKRTLFWSRQKTVHKVAKHKNNLLEAPKRVSIASRKSLKRSLGAVLGIEGAGSAASSPSISTPHPFTSFPAMRFAEDKLQNPK
jgi:hypothetical protein